MKCNPWFILSLSLLAAQPAGAAADEASDLPRVLLIGDLRKTLK